MFILPLYKHFGGGVRVCGDAVLLDFQCGFTEIFILSLDFAVFQNQAVCGTWKCSGNFNAVFFFAMFYSVRFCGIRTPLTLPSKTLAHPQLC